MTSTACSTDSMLSATSSTRRPATRNAPMVTARRTRAARSARSVVATDAAGEGITLQFCWSMVNYDTPWNPARLEQRMGRIHRYGQQHDCLIFNFAAVNTREGRVLQKLLERL